MEANCKTKNATVPVRCDLHTHSVFSDGTYTPAQLIAAAKDLGFIVALTDHNTVAGLPDFMEAAQALGVTAVPGIELSTEYAGKELHLVGLFILPKHYAAMEQLLQKQRTKKEASNIALVERLNQAGYRIRYENVKQRSPKGNTNRAHVAAELMEQGYVTSIQDAFDTLLREGGEFYVPPARLQLLDAIQYLRQIGALPILAHPLQNLSESALRALLPIAKEAGLLGVETMHSSYTQEEIRLSEAIATEFDLLPSGGSDFHGTAKPDTALCTGKGQLNIPSDVYFNLLAARECQYQ